MEDEADEMWYTPSLFPFCEERKLEVLLTLILESKQTFQIIFTMQYGKNLKM